ncbi:MAG: ABC transporter substrate-binding protein [Propionibacteriaceae bacterium]|jgi:ribose transport system substrate-binding protein|nr:ABC transporter substrate-binding protein [Propionibacteriaceae bacterium]
MRKTIAAFAVAALALSASACSSKAPEASTDSSAGAASTDGKPYIAIISKGFQHQFWQAVKNGAEEEAKAENVDMTFEGPADETMVEDQINMLTQALAKNPQAIGFAALDSKAAESLLEQAKSKNIPVIAFDSGVDSDIPITTAATDNKAAAKEGAKHMCELIGNKGKVGMIVHDQTSKSGTDRRDGFIDGIKEYCPDVELLEPQYGGGDQAKSADIAKAILSANPDIAGIFGSNEGSAIGALKGVQEAKKTGEVTLVGFDSGKAQLDAIRSGEMAGAITQDPVGMGKKVVEAAVKAIKGETLPSFIDTGFYWYDKSNIDDPTIAAVLYD